MKAILVRRDEHEYVVLVEEGPDHDDFHIRLAAWHYVFGKDTVTTYAQVCLETNILPNVVGPFKASVYQPIEFKGFRFVKKAEYNGDYYSAEYVDWLEKQLGIA